MIEQKESLTKCWSNFRSNINGIIPPTEVNGWLNSLKLVDCNSEKITFSGLNRSASEYVCQKYSKTFRSLIKKHFDPVFSLSNDFKIFFVLKNDKSSTIQNLVGLGETDKKIVFSSTLRSRTGLNINNNFQRFINGNNTDIAYAASLAVAENVLNPKYNPLFLCGAVGLGKTHLMQAIGLEVIEKKTTENVWYCSAEGFTNSLIDGIRFSKTHQIRQKYRSLDLLMIDDIQFLENKYSTQEEFFHTLNELILDNKQVVITADRFPREIKFIEERLISRFSAGMVAKIEPPNFETRSAIIRNELELLNLKLSDEIIEHIAHSVRSNVRELKGVLTKLEAESSLLGLDLTLELTRSILKDVLNLDKSPKSVEEIIKVVANDMNLKYKDIISEKRDRHVSNARQLAMYIAREITDLSYPVIGSHFDKNHTSVIQACKKIKISMEESSEIKQLVNSLIRKISNN